MPGILKDLHHSYKIANKEYFLDVKYFQRKITIYFLLYLSCISASAC